MVVTHNQRGQPIAWKVLRGSDDRIFDAAALRAVADAVATFHLEDARDTQRIRRTTWEFASFLRWGRMELLLDPGFTPPGEVLEDESGVTGKSTLVRQARLVSLDFAGGSAPGQ